MCLLIRSLHGARAPRARWVGNIPTYRRPMQAGRLHHKTPRDSFWCTRLASRSLVVHASRVQTSNIAAHIW